MNKLVNNTNGGGALDQMKLSVGNLIGARPGEAVVHNSGNPPTGRDNQRDGKESNKRSVPLSGRDSELSSELWNQRKKITDITVEGVGSSNAGSKTIAPYEGSLDNKLEKVFLV